ncbi:C factor cell-cell signaling protein [Vibrio cholerae]|nr:C factor cell-cell signaling protein [Vibrio cholerae]
MVQEALNRFSEANVHATYHSTTPTWPSLPRFPPRSAVFVITNSAVGTAIEHRKRRSICC